MTSAMGGDLVPPRVLVSAIIGHPGGTQCLMLEGEDGWALPCVPSRLGFHERIEEVRRAVARSVGMEVTVLRDAWHGEHPDGSTVVGEAIFVLECHGPAWPIPRGARWVGAAALDGLSLAHPRHRAVIAQWLAEEESGAVPALRRSWARRGWFERVSGWIDGQLARHDLALTGPLEQVRQWGISAVLRGSTDGGLVYFKATAPLFRQEAGVTVWLAGEFTQWVPAPLAVEQAEGWMLTRAWTGGLLAEAPFARWEEALAALGTMQRETVERVPTLLAVAAVDRRLPRLAAAIPGLLAAPETAAALTREERERLRGLAPALEACCARLEHCGVPPTLMHGDFHARNVAVTEDGVRLFDWTDACVAHPFLDLATLLDDQGSDQLTPVEWDTLRSGYLRPWSRFASKEKVAEAAALAVPVGALHQAVSYQAIVACLEAGSRWELADGLSFWLRRLLAVMPPVSASSSVGPGATPYGAP